jgi:sulfur carrier protein
MNATINGTPRELPDGMTLDALLAELGLTGNGVAVAVNQRVVSRRTFPEHPLREGDDVEIVRAAAGG